MLVLIASTLGSLILGIMFIGTAIAVGKGLWTSGLGIYLVIGVLFLVASLGARTSWMHGYGGSYLQETSVMLALYVAVEFLAGALLAYVGIANLVSASEGLDWSFVAFAIFGLVLVTDSILFYRSGFKQSVGKSKGD